MRDVGLRKPPQARVAEVSPAQNRSAHLPYLKALNMRHFFQRLFRDQHAATAVEYAVMLALILMLCIGGIVLVGQSTKTSWENSSSSIQSAMGS